MSSKSSSSEFAPGITKIERDMRAAEHGGEAEMNALLKDVQAEESKYKGDPDKLSSFNDALSKQLQSAGLLLPGVEITGLAKNKVGELRLVFADTSGLDKNMWELGEKDGELLKPEAGKTARKEETYINENGDLAATIVNADGSIQTVVQKNGDWQIERPPVSSGCGLYENQSGQTVGVCVTENGKVLVTVKGNDGRWVAGPETGE
jgi:hypothetical protein